VESSPAWRRIAFVLIVCVLLALGAYLIGPFTHRTGQGGADAGESRSSARPRSTASSGPSPSRPAPAGLPAAGQPDIYQWLPFTQAGLRAAAATATRFGGAYGTYSYTESAASYGATLEPSTAPVLVRQIEGAYSAPGVASLRTGSKQVATATATIISIRAFGPSSLTFVLQISQKVTATSGSTTSSTDYAVTLTGSGTIWQVTSVELASLGNS
jgi:hypothetical protein